MTVKSKVLQLTLDAGLQKAGQESAESAAGSDEKALFNASQTQCIPPAAPAITLTAARATHTGNIEAGLLRPSPTPGDTTAASTASPHPRRTQRTRMRFKAHRGMGVTCDAANCKRQPEIHVRAAGWLCGEHWERWLREADADWREVNGKAKP